VEPWFIVAAVLGLAAVSATSVAIARGRTLERVRAAVGAPTTDAVTDEAIRLREAERRAEQALAQERVDHEALVDQLDLGVIDLDGRLGVVAANAAAHTRLGRAPGSLLGLEIIEVFLDTQVESLASTALSHGAAAGEVRLRGPDGPTLIVRARRSTAGGVWIVLQDVSELRRLQQIRTEFLDNLSHELRTPLTTVSLLAETLAREASAAGTGVPARMRDRIAKIEVETGHLVQMVSELLDLSRIESGGTLRLIDDVDIGRLAVESTERLRLFAERQGVTLAAEVAEPLPPVRGDEGRLGQVLVNLLHNAVKFSPNGGDVVARVRRDGPEVVASVADHGVGVPRAAQARIFERFYKVDRARVRGEAGEAGGTGLGLAIARHIVDQHGGRIWVESDEGSGSTFSFAIPIAAEDA
jgi:two-component system phosphate regulon sensor histidine kinase PhoR